LNGQIIPFLGAGISYDAQIVGKDLPTRYVGKMPKTNELTNAILTDIGGNPLRATSSAWSRAEEQRISALHPENRSFADTAQLFIDLHSEGEAGLFAPGGPLDIRLFLNLSPKPAHHYIAWLVREGLFSEVISTNYDCALEKAYAASLGEAWSHETAAQLDHCKKNSFFVAISSRDAYRDHANQSQDLRLNGIPTTVLRLYKINGCSAAYKKFVDTKMACPPGTLVITERHLQDFGLRKWAEDLFRDRFRCRTMVFSGFGAEEPQVRFTALRVLEEFSDSSEPRSAVFDLAKPPHCFLQEYNPTLSASQLQIAKAAIRPPPTRPDPSPAVYSNVGPDKFWRDLYESVLPPLIARRLERSIVFAWLREHDNKRYPSSRAIAHSLRTKLFSADETTESSISQWLRDLLAGDGTLFLMDLAWRARQTGRMSESLTSGYYEEFDRVDSIPVMLLYVFHLLGVEANAVHVCPGNPGFWIRLSVTEPDFTKSPKPFRWVLVLEREPGGLPELPSAESRIAVCLVLRKNGAEPDKRRPTAAHSIAVTWRVIPLADLITLASATAPASYPAERFPEAHYRRILLDGNFAALRQQFYDTSQSL
jgi:hypothetical protein